LEDWKYSLYWFSFYPLSGDDNLVYSHCYGDLSKTKF
jgi:hypothetical protein